MRYSKLCMLMFLAQTALSGTPDPIRTQLETAVSATGTVYIAARNALVNLGSNAVPQLADITSNTNEPWQVRLMAGIVVERIQRGSEITALVHRNWRDDPEYGAEWDKFRGGPVRGLARLVTKRCRERSLWWHY